VGAADSGYVGDCGGQFGVVQVVGDGLDGLGGHDGTGGDRCSVPGVVDGGCPGSAAPRPNPRTAREAEPELRI
jgi:hypothetical protein